jgi:YD repeat-containing protein
MNHNLFPQPIGINGYQTILGSCSDSEALRVSHGNLVRTYTVAQISTVGPTLRFALTHNSRDSSLGVVGRNWRHTGMANLTFAGSPVNLVTYMDEQGRRYDFEQVAGNWQLKSDSLFLRMNLTQVSTQWKLTGFADGDTLVFDSNGVLLQMVDAHSQALTFNYTSGVLTSISEPTGRSLLLTYTSGLLTKITDPGSQETTLGYDGNSNLTSITGPEGCVLTYGYAGGSTNGLILSRTDARNYTYSYTFDGDGKLLTVTNPASKTLTYVYDTASEPVSHPHGGSSRAFSRTRLTDADAQVWDYRFDLYGNLWRILDPLNHSKRFFWSDQQTLLYASEGYGVNAGNTLGPLDSPYNRYTRNIFDSLGNQTASIDANGVITQMEYDANSRLVAVTPARATLAVGGEWFEHFGKDGFLMCSALNTSGDLWQRPSYVDSSGILPGESDNSNAFDRALPVLPNHQLDPRAPWICMPGSPVRNTYRRTLGQWKNQGSNTSFTFRIPISQTGAFNLSFYTHCADQTYYGDNANQWERVLANSFGRDVEILVTDIDPVTSNPRRQKFRMPNTAGGVWMTFGVYATASSAIRVKVRSRVSNSEQFPVISCIAFDPIENQRTTMTYTGSDMTQVVNPLGQVTLMEYNADGTLKKVTDAKSRDTQFFYLDSAKNLTKIIDAISGESLLTYDANGNVLTSKDQDLRTTTMEYDGKNRVVKLKDPLNHETLFDFDAAGNLIKITDAKLRETTLIYNNLNRLVTLKDALNQETLLEYDFTGRLTKITDPLSRVTEFVFDAAGRRIQSTQADGQKVLYAFNAINRLVSVTGPNATRSNWDDIELQGALNVLDNPSMELESPSSPASNPQRWNHSDYYTGYSKAASSAEAHSGNYSLDVDSGKHWRQENVPTYAGGRYLAKAWAKKGAAGASTVTASIAGKVRNFQAVLETQTDTSQQQSVSNSWTELKPQVIQIPGDTQATHTLPPLGQLELRCEKSSPSDPVSTVYFDDATLHMLNTCMEYDGENLREVATPDGARYRRDFDRVGRLYKLTDPQGRVLSFTYDGLNRVVGVKDDLGNSLAYSFDATGQMVTFTDARSQVMSFEYDALDRLKKIIYPDSTYEQFAYSAAGDLTSYTDAMAQQRTFSYDNAHRLTQVTYPGSQTLVLAYDEVGNLTQRTERNGDVETYSYDTLYRLTRSQFTPGGSSSSRAWDLTSVYDAVGNRTRLGPTTVSSSVYGTARYGTGRYKQPAHYWSVPTGGIDSMNRLTDFEDSQGNATSLDYDVEGRLSSLTCPNGAVTSADYDIVGKLLGLRTVKGSSELLNLRYGYNLSSDRLALQTEKGSYTYHLDRGGRLIQETVNRWVTEHSEHLAQGELSGCLLDAAHQKVELLGLEDDFSQLHLDRWQPTFLEVDGGGALVQPLTTGAQLRADQGVHFIYPSAWSAHTYGDFDAYGGVPTSGPLVRDKVGYLNNQVHQRLELKRLLSGDFDIVFEWDGFDLASPGTGSSELQRYSESSHFNIGVDQVDGSSLCYLERGTTKYGTAPAYQNFYRWNYQGSDNFASTTDSSGKFRLKREGSAFNLYLWNAGTSSWDNCSGNITTGYTTANLRLRIKGYCYRGSVQYRAVSLSHNGGSPKDFLTTPAGIYTSCIYDAGQSVEWSRIAWEETLASNTDVDFQVAVSNSADGPWTYRGPDSTSGTYFTTPAGETLPNDANFEGRYARFKARLSTSDGLNTPKFGNVHLTFGGTGLLASSCRNFVYDDAGNITSIVTVTDAGSATDDRNPVAAPINNLNQIKRRVVGGATWNYTYDLDGNMTGKTDGTNTYTYTWSDENRLTRVQGPGGLDVTYTYDSIGRMLTRSSAGLLTQFVWDGWDCVREVTRAPRTLSTIFRMGCCRASR